MWPSRALTGLAGRDVAPSLEGIQAVLKKRWRKMFRAKFAKKEILWVDDLPFVRDSQ
jgi:hypothetical protein